MCSEEKRKQAKLVDSAVDKSAQGNKGLRTRIELVLGDLYIQADAQKYKELEEERDFAYEHIRRFS